MSLNSKAVITLQVGHYANFVGAHFWNAQELSFYQEREKNDLDHDVIHREGQTINKEVTYTPRLVSIDLKGALGSLPEFGDLYHEVGQVAKTDLSAQASQNWHLKLDIERAETHHKSHFLRDLEATENRENDEDKDIDVKNKEGVTKVSDSRQLDNEVKLWSDFLRTRFHPQTNIVVREHSHANTIDPFDVFGHGVNLWTNRQTYLSDEVEDRLRFFAEEADFLKGFQMINDCTDGFGGVSAMIAEYIRDEFSGQCLLAFPVIPSGYAGTLDAQKSTSKLLNMALTAKGLADHCDLITPMSLSNDTFPLRGMKTRQIPSFKYREDLSYHSSAALALGFDALTLPWRLLNGPYASPSQVASGLNTFGRKFASLQLSFPFPKPKNEKLGSFLHGYSMAEAVYLTPHISQSHIESIWCQSVSTRGIAQSNLELLGYFDTVMPRVKTAVTSSQCPVLVGSPFPSHAFDSPYWDSIDKSVAVMSMWQSSRDSGNIVKSLAERSAKINLSKFHRFQEAGLDTDLFNEVREDLYNQSQTYEASSDAF